MVGKRVIASQKSITSVQQIRTAAGSRMTVFAVVFIA
jgi:hypothetical protein